MRTLNTIIIAISLLVSSVAFASEPADRQVMTDVLKGIDTIPNAQKLQERFPKGEELLVTIALDGDENMYVRKRATTLLSTYKSVEAARGLDTIAAQSDALRPFAVYTLARTFGESASPELVGKVAAYLSDPSDEVRAWTVRGLRWMQHDSARVALERVAADSADAELSKLAARSLKKWRPASTTQTQ